MLRFRLPSALSWMHAAILLALVLPYGIHLGTSSIWNANEAFYAETPREMIVSGDYLAPQFNFEPRTQKPPLTYYLILGSYKLFGIHEFAVRFPGALAAVGILLFSYATARALFNARAAIMCAAICATTARIFILARRLPIDILLLFFLTGTLFFLVRAVQKETKGRWAWVYLFAALGFLTKGPIAVVIPAGAFFAWILWSRRPRPKIHIFTGSAIFACVALPWYVLVYMARGWTYIAPFFLRDNLGRYAGESMGPSRDIFYYFSVYAIDFFPWSLLFLAVLYQLWRARKKEQPMRSLHFGLPLIWCLLIFIVFSLSKNKQEYYIASMYPAAAVVLSGILDRRLFGTASGTIAIWNKNCQPCVSVDGNAYDSSRRLFWRATYGVLACFLMILSVLTPYILGAVIPDISLTLRMAPAAILIIGMGLLLRSVLRREYASFFSRLATPVWALFVLVSLFYIPALESVRPVKAFCRQIETQWHKDRDEAGYFRTSLPSMVFYLRRPIFQESSYEQMAIRFRSPKGVFCILTEKDYAYFANQGLNLYILDRHSRFTIRMSFLLKTGYSSGDNLLLVSNRLSSQMRSSEGRFQS
jgi:4-amino-4-deoxy-L-arabinose transferase-like glycosyltransferase